MTIVEPSAALEYDFDGAEVMKHLEACGRTCYKSEGNDADKFVRMLIRRGHESVLEHFSATFRIVCDRGVMAELTRHRLCSFSVESTRYVNYSKRGLKFIKPLSTRRITDIVFEEIADHAERAYRELLSEGVKPEEARSILPLSLATELTMTANLREWRHLLKLRTSSKAHPQMRQIAGMILSALKAKLPVVFEDICYDA